MLKKINSLRLSRHIKRAFEKGLTYRGAYFRVKAFAGNVKNPARLAVIISKKTAKLAVDRNLYRRRIKAAFYPLLPDLSGWDIVVNLNGEIKSAKYAKLEEEVKRCSDFLQSKSSGFTRKP